ncbi:hypothetical protein [Longispora urticae]
MCVSAGPAEFTGTILYAGRRHHPEHGPIEVLGYQNTAVNLAGGPNAMLPHVPGRVTREQFLHVGCPVDYPADLRHKLREFLPGTVIGREFGADDLANGDFTIGYDDLLRGDLDRIERVQPDGTRFPTGVPHPA